MNPLTTLVRSLGNSGAITNAETALESSIRDEWLAQGLASRLDAHKRDVAATARPIGASVRAA